MALSQGDGAEQVFAQNVQFSVKLEMTLIQFTCRRQIGDPFLTFGLFL